jgi:hypothetical protein
VTPATTTHQEGIQAMNPSLLGQVSHQHITDMQHSAAHRAAAHQAAARRAAGRQAVEGRIAGYEPGAALARHEPAGDSPVGPGRRVTIRNRAGWTLVQIGLRLAASSADA